MKTQNCEYCLHANFIFTEAKFLCLKGHKPRFYLPKNDIHTENWGYKRKCLDYTFENPMKKS
jgi:hypothetical protein